MAIRFCSYITDTEEPCGEMCEGFTHFCASHNRLMRKQETDSVRESEKRAQQIAQQKAKNSIPRKKPNKVSEKMQSLNANYIILADEFKRQNPTCLARVNEYCTGKTESVHHKRGRGRYLLDVSTFFPCCLSCHGYIEAHPKEAKEKGWSESRLATEPPI